MHFFIVRMGIISVGKFLLFLRTVEIVSNPVQNRVKSFRWCPNIPLTSNTPAVAFSAKNLDWEWITNLQVIQVILRQLLRKRILNFFVNSVSLFKLMESCSANDGVTKVHSDLFPPIINWALLNCRIFLDFEAPICLLAICSENYSVFLGAITRRIRVYCSANHCFLPFVFYSSPQLWKCNVGLVARFFIVAFFGYLEVVGGKERDCVFGDSKYFDDGTLV